MLHALQHLAAWLAAPSDIGHVSPDLLAHPLIERMSERELADLPMRANFNDTAGQPCCPA